MFILNDLMIVWWEHMHTTIVYYNVIIIYMYILHEFAKNDCYFYIISQCERVHMKYETYTK